MGRYPGYAEIKGSWVKALMLDIMDTGIDEVKKDVFKASEIVVDSVARRIVLSKKV